MRDEGGKTDPLEAGPRHPALAALATPGAGLSGGYWGMFMFIPVRPYASVRRTTYGRQSNPIRHAGRDRGPVGGRGR